MELIYTELRIRSEPADYRLTVSSSLVWPHQAVCFLFPKQHSFQSGRGGCISDAFPTQTVETTGGNSSSDSVKRDLCEGIWWFLYTSTPETRISADPRCFSNSCRWIMRIYKRYEALLTDRYKQAVKIVCHWAVAAFLPFIPPMTNFRQLMIIIIRIILYI